MSLRIRRADHEPRLEPATPDQAGKAAWPVVAAVEAPVDGRGAAEFTQHEHNRRLKQVVLAQVAKQSGQGRVEHAGVLAVPIEVVGMRVESRKGDFHRADARFNQPPRQKTAAAEGTCTIRVAEPLGLAVELKRR